MFETHLGCFTAHPDPQYEDFIAAVGRLFDLVLELMFQAPVINKVVETKPVKDFNAVMDTIYSTADKEIKRKLKAFNEKYGGKVDGEMAKEFIPYLYHVQEMSLSDIKSDIAAMMMAAVETVIKSVLKGYPLGFRKTPALLMLVGASGSHPS